MASCAPTAVEEEGKTVTGKVVEKEAPKVEEEEKEEVVPEEKGPVYGSTLTLYIVGNTLHGFVPAGEGPSSTGCYPVYDALIKEDITKGPQGTNEATFDGSHTALDFFTGALAERWEQTDLTTIIFHIRKGVHFQNKQPVYGREVTADDVVYSFSKFLEESRGRFYKPPSTPPEKLQQWTALDKYTVQVKLPWPDVFVLREIGRDIVVMPHEIEDEYGNFEDWRNACGTGPFIVTDVVTGSSISYVRNPDCWEHDPRYPENRLPYVDGMKLLLIPDAATVLAALRTGKIDSTFTSWSDAESLMKSNPELNYRAKSGSSGILIWFRSDVEPFSNVAVRRALTMAIDQEEIARDIYKGHAKIHFYPVQASDGPCYVPLEELPTSQRELFEYHPDKAKQLLTDAGYPPGSLKLQVTCTVYPAEMPDLVSLIASYWERIGIKTEITVLEWASWYAYALGHRYPNMAIASQSIGNPSYRFTLQYMPGESLNLSVVNDPYIVETWKEIQTITDVHEQNEKIKELSLYAIDQAYYPNIVAQDVYAFWQPWLKGYAGETYIGRFANTLGFTTYAWIDKDLKQKR
jgi:peptide/nickel transport system substrate-binding protein